MCSRRVCGCRYGRSRSFAFSGLEGGTCHLPALPTRRRPDHLADQLPHPRPPGRPVRRRLLRRPLRRLQRALPVPRPCARQERGAPEDADPPGPSLTFSAGRPADGPADPVVAWSRQFAQVIAEILAGARSPRQLAPWTTERVRDRISLLTQTLTPGQKPRIRRIVTSRPAARVVEMTVVLSFGPRSRALALRLEQLPGRQPAPGLPARPARRVCTEIEVG